MEFITNKSKEHLLYVIRCIEGLIDDDKEYTELAKMQYQVDYQNKINTELLVEQVKELWKVYNLTDDVYYKKGV